MDMYPLLCLAEVIVWCRSEHALPVENRIRSRRQAAGLSQQELARRCGMTRQALNAIEMGHYVPSTLVAMRLAKALGCWVWHGRS
jgi:putative molybdopterin biosynthesis protein